MAELGVFNQLSLMEAGPVAGATDILNALGIARLVPKDKTNASTFRITVALGATGTFAYHPYVAGAAQSVIEFNGGANLLVNRVYTFTLGVRSLEQNGLAVMYDFRASNAGIIRKLAIDEVTGGL